MRVKHLMQSTLNRQVLIPTIGFLIITFIFLIILTSTTAKRLVYNAETASALERTKEVYEIITQLYQQTQMLTDLATQNYYIQEGFRQNNSSLFDTYINAHLRLEEFHETIFIMNNQGTIVGHSIKDRIGRDGTMYSFWQEISRNNKRNYIDKIPFLSPVTGNVIQFVASRIDDVNGNFLGIVVYVIDFQKFAEIFINHYTIAKRGYFYLIDAQSNVISHVDRNLVMNERTKNLSFNNQVLASKEKYGILNYVWQGDNKTISYAKLDMLDWVICASMFDEDLAEVGRVISNYIIIISLISIVILSLIIIFILRKRISQPVGRVLNLLNKFAENNFTQKPANIDLARIDEVGKLVKAYESTRNQISKALLNVYKVTETLNERSKSLSETSNNLVHDAGQMNSQAQLVSASSEEISSNANVIASSAEQASVSVSTVATATEELSASINQVASASEQTSSSVSSTVNEINKLEKNIDDAGESVSTLVGEINGIVSAIEEMNATLSEISKNTQQASDVSLQAFDEAKTANKVMNELQTLSNNIGKVVKLINDIADQTNMLALNATIEAASAGDAGKGFAVVANEVKSLAKQTAEATASIATQIDDVQKSVKNSSSAINHITEIIQKLNEINTVIAASIEEQNITTNEIANSSGRMANFANEVKSVITKVVDYTQKININAKEATHAVNEISKNSLESAHVASEIANNSNQASIGVQEITRNTVEISQGIQEVTRSISEMVHSIESTTFNAETTKEAADKLLNLSTELKTMLDLFKIER